MNRRVIATLLVGATTFTVYVALVNDGPANRVATCPAVISPECQTEYGVREYETLRFPVRRDVLPDGGVAIGFPPALRNPDSAARECVETTDLSACDLSACALNPAICLLWADPQPFRLARSASKYVIPDCRLPDGGWQEFPPQGQRPDCWRTGPLGLEDGGRFWGGCTPFLRSLAEGTQCLDAPGNIVKGGRIEDSL